jgi:hypothetical protein
MNDSNSNSAHVDQSGNSQDRTSEQEAVRITQQDDVPELVEFVLVLKMKRPVSTDKAARLLKHMVKQQMASNSSQIADRMRDDGWETDLSEGETLAFLADRVLAYLATHEGIALFNFFVKTFAKTNGEMFE